MIHNGNLEITKDNHDKYKHITEVTGNLSVSGSAKLDALTTVGGYLYVDGSAKLDALTTVGGYLYVDGSAKLDALTTVGGNLYVSGSAKLDAPLLTTVGGNLYVDGSAKLDAPNIKHKDSDKAKSIAKKALAASLKKSKLVLVDGILSFLVSVKATKSIKIFKVNIVGKLEVSFIVQKGELFSHGKTIKEAKDSLKYKISSRDTAPFKKWKLDTVVTQAKMIEAYRVITGACEYGVRNFMEGKKIPARLSVKKAIEITDGVYGSKSFSEFFK